MGQFTVDLKAFAAKVEARKHAAVRKMVIDILSRLVYRSPVGDPTLWSRPAPPGYVGGHFRANWQVGTGGPVTGVRDAIDGQGGPTVALGVAAVPDDAAGRVHYITNNLPYGPELERGHSTQAPFGLVGITTLEFNLIAAQAVAEAKNEHR